MADDLKVKVKLEVEDDIDTSKVKKTAENAGKEIGENVNKGMSGVIVKGMAIWDAIKGAIQTVWNATKQFLSDSINLANSYESAFAGVKKTVDGTAQDFAKLNNTLKNLAKEIPLTYQELSGIMELGGQLGVQTKDLEKFTKAVAQLGTATNLTSENAAQMLAQFANVTKMDLNDIDKLGSVIVDLGNNFATTESNIVNFAQRIAGAGQIAGISQQNIMAIATAFSSVGIEAEAGGTAVQKVLLDMNSAVTMGGDQLEKYAKIVGKTTEEFKNLYNEHPEQAFVEFVKALQGAGNEAQALLEALGLNDQRLVRGFLSLSQNSDLLTEAIERSNKAWEDNIALSNEAEQRYSTTESQIIMQQNERANMMAAIGEKMQSVVLRWEQVKTTFVDAIGSFMGITMESNEATESLEAQIKETIKAMEDLDAALARGEISLQEYVKRKIELDKQQEEAQKLYKEEKERLEELQDTIDDTKDKMKMYQDQYERNLKLYGENDLLTKDSLKNYEKWQQKLEDLLIVQEAGINLSDKEIERRKKQKEYVNQLDTAYQDLKKAEEEYDKLKVDDSTTRAELEASRKKVEQLRKAYEELEKGMASVGIVKKLDLTKAQESRDKLHAKVQEEIKKKINGGSSNDNGGVLGDLLLGGSGGGGGGKSKAEEMLESFDKELETTRTNLDNLRKEHQTTYDNIQKNIEKAEKEYDKLRETAAKTWKDAEKSIRSYNEQLEKNQMDSITKLGQRYVELKEKRAENDNDYLKGIVGEISDKEWQLIRDEGWTFKGYDYSELKDVYELYKEMKLIEENTTEEQRKSADFTEKTSKAQEIINNMKEKEKELEEKKAAAMEKQAIAQAMMNQENGKQYIKTVEGKGTWYYDELKKQWQQIFDEDNIEYAKQLENQSTNLNDQLKQYKDEKDNEVEILSGIISQKTQLENTYHTLYEKNLKDEEKLLDNAIIKSQKLLDLRKEYLSLGGTLTQKAYGGTLLNGQASLVGENGPEQIIARQASYVQPRNAGNSYSTVNNTTDNSFSINGMQINVNNVDEFLDELRQKMTYRN